MSEYSEFCENYEHFAARLLHVTKDCRLDMHEPDEQGFTAKVWGRVLDNACGDDPSYNGGELTVALIREEKREWFNLADLLALARIGAETVLETKGITYFLKEE